MRAYSLHAHPRHTYPKQGWLPLVLLDQEGCHLTAIITSAHHGSPLNPVLVEPWLLPRGHHLCGPFCGEMGGQELEDQVSDLISKCVFREQSHTPNVAGHWLLVPQWKAMRCPRSTSRRLWQWHGCHHHDASLFKSTCPPCHGCPNPQSSRQRTSTAVPKVGRTSSRCPRQLGLVLRVGD